MTSHAPDDMTQPYVPRKAPSPLPAVSGEPPLTPPTPAVLPQFPGLDILEEVGRGVGGMGVVYRARELSLDRIVAVKTTKAHLDTPDGRAFFLREARAAARLDHPNILRIHRFVPEHEPPFYVMQFVEGRPLAAACLGRDEIFIAAQLEKIARALGYAHAHGIVHRDIKPDNILVDLDDEPHIADFGLAGPLDAAVQQGADGDASAAMGTPSFIAPEVYAGETPGPAADIYALGITMYQLLTGRLPFLATNLADLRVAVLQTDPPLLQDIRAEIPEPLQRICLKAMERDPAARYSSAPAMADDLHRFLDGREVSARPTRYHAQLRGKLQNHLTEIRLWQEQNLIDVREMDRLSLPYHGLLQAISPWRQLSGRFPWEAVVLRLGGWFVLISSILWLWTYWPRLTHQWQRLLAIGLPALVINLAGWILLWRRSRINALIHLSTGALLLPLFTAVLLVECGILPDRQGDYRELFPPSEVEADGAESGPSAQPPPRPFLPTNMQLTVSAAAFVVYCFILVAATGARILATWVAAGFYLLFTCLLLLAGLKEWLMHNEDQVSRALVAYILFSLLFWPAGHLLSRRERLRPWATIVYAFFPLPFAIFFSLLARFGSYEWLGHKEAWNTNNALNLWLMADGLIYFAIALWGGRARSGSARFWSAFFMLLVPIHLLFPTNIMFNDPRYGLFGLTIGDALVTTYELASLLIALAMVIVGTRLRRHILTLSGLAALAVFLFRVTQRHFESTCSWPLGLAIVGGLAMAAALASLLLRARWKRESLM